MYITAELELLATNIEEIEIIINSLKNNKSLGQDNRNSKLQLYCRKIIIN